jgi:hypothetical protein
VRVTDTGIQSGIPSVTYRSMNWQENHASVPRWKMSASYVTGAHSLKVGYTGFIQEQDNYNYTNTNDISYTFRNGVPQSLTMVGANPIRYRSRAYSQSAYLQEQWTIRRLTLQAPRDTTTRGASTPSSRSAAASSTRGSSTSRPTPRAASPASTTSIRGSASFRPLRQRQDVGEVQRGRYTDSASSDGRGPLATR